jgi:hypothetical protein
MNESTLRLGSNGHRDPRRDKVEHDHRGAVVRGDRVREPDGELGVGTAADRHEDAVDLSRPTLLHDRDVARRLSNDLVDGRREDGRAAVAAVVADRRLAAPAEDDQVGFLLGGRLDDALGGVSPDAHDRVDRSPVRCVIEHLLEQSSRMPGPCRSLGQRHALRHFDDPQRRQLARLGFEHGGAQPDQFLGRAWVGDRDEDPRRQRRPRAHADSDVAADEAPFQRCVR